MNLKFGRTPSSKPAKLPKGVSKGGRIKTDLPEINWTPSKLVITVVALSFPYIAVTIASFLSGNYVVGGIFTFIGLLTIGLYFLLRYLEKADF